MKIRKAKPIDVRKVSQLKKKTIEVINKEYNKKQLKVLKKDYSIENVKRNIKNREMFCLVDKEEILGVIDLKDDKIGSLFVRYDSVGKSYGKKLLNFIEHYAKKRGIKKVWLYSTPYAEEFYLNKGFRIVSKGIWINKGIKFPEVKMEKKLK